MEESRERQPMPPIGIALLDEGDQLEHLMLGDFGTPDKIIPIGYIRADFKPIKRLFYPHSDEFYEIGEAKYVVDKDGLHRIEDGWEYLSQGHLMALCFHTPTDAPNLDCTLTLQDGATLVSTLAVEYCENVSENCDYWGFIFKWKQKEDIDGRLLISGTPDEIEAIIRSMRFQF